MTRPLSAAEQDQRDAMTALRQPPIAPPLDTRGRVIHELEAKVTRQREEIQRLVKCIRGRNFDMQMLTLELCDARAEIDRLRAAEAQA